jgi:hypothetical protein
MAFAFDIACSTNRQEYPNGPNLAVARCAATAMTPRIAGMTPCISPDRDVARLGWRHNAGPSRLATVLGFVFHLRTLVSQNWPRSGLAAHLQSQRKTPTSSSVRAAHPVPDHSDLRVARNGRDRRSDQALS